MRNIRLLHPIRFDDFNSRVEHLALHHALALGRRRGCGEDPLHHVHAFDDVPENREAVGVAVRRAGIIGWSVAREDKEVGLRAAGLEPSHHD